MMRRAGNFGRSAVNFGNNVYNNRRGIASVGKNILGTARDGISLLGRTNDFINRLGVTSTGFNNLNKQLQQYGNPTLDFIESELQ